VTGKVFNIRPSRRFMIQQAVLNAVQNEWPGIVTTEYLRSTIRRYTRGGTSLPGWLEAAVCREFRALTERWAA
jgi:hypothetical protein